MRKVHLTMLALALSVAMLVGSVVPAMASKPNEPRGNQPVAWVDSSINYAGYMLPNHPRHALTVKLLSDTTTVGKVTAGVGHDMYSVDTQWGTFWQGETYFWSWYDDGLEVKMADFAVFLYMEGTGNVGLIRYQIADYGEPGNNDWHRVWYWVWDNAQHTQGHWMPTYGMDMRIPYVGGNAFVHGDLTVTGFPDDWDPENLPILLPSPKG